MKNIKIYAFIYTVITLVILCFTACDNNNDSTPMTSAQTSKIAVRLTDAPGDYDKVNLEVIDVLIKNNSTDDDKGWISIGAKKPVLYDIMSLTGGVNALIADTVIPSGYLGQIRLLLGENNTLVKNGITYPLNTPSAQQSGLKLLVNQTLQPGISYDFMLDFDVDKSIVKAGNSGIYNLHPVIRVFTTVSLGIIKGTITPVGFPVKASVMVDGVETSSYTNALGTFQINGIPAGSYTLKLTPESTSGYLEATVTNIMVTNGLTTDIGNIVLAAVK